LLRSAVIGRLRIEQAKAFVVLCCQNHVLLPGTLCKARPITREVRFWIELLRELFIFLGGDSLHFHHPLVPPEHAVESPVNEHSEFCLVPPLHSALSIRLCLIRFGPEVLWILGEHGRDP